MTSKEFEKLQIGDVIGYYGLDMLDTQDLVIEIERESGRIKTKEFGKDQHYSDCYIIEQGRKYRRDDKLNKEEVKVLISKVDESLDRDRRNHSGEYRGGWDDAITAVEEAIESGKEIAEAEKRCKNCKFWKIGWQPAVSFRVGNCKSCKIHYGRHPEESDSAAYIDTEEYQADFEMGEDFGCIHFESGHPKYNVNNGTMVYVKEDYPDIIRDIDSKATEQNNHSEYVELPGRMIDGKYCNGLLIPMPIK